MLEDNDQVSQQLVCQNDLQQLNIQHFPILNHQFYYDSMFINFDSNILSAPLICNTNSLQSCKLSENIFDGFSNQTDPYESSSCLIKNEISKFENESQKRKKVIKRQVLKISKCF
jgi:hypothetical protein